MANILIVDDDPAVRDLLKDFLEREGHSVETAITGMEGLTKLRWGSFQLATLDVDMPLLNGIETLKLIRQDPKLAKLPVLMCTAHNSMEALDTAFGLGATDYFVKPFNFPALKKSLAKVFAAAGKDDQAAGC